MLDFLLGVLSSIIGNLLTPSFKEWTGFKDEAIQPAPAPRLPDPADEEALEQRRRAIREQWQIRGWTMFVYFTLIFFVGVALGMPLAFKTSFFSQPLDCSALRIADLCADYYWEAKVVRTLLVLLIILCATGIWFLAQALADPIARFIHYNRRHVGPILYRRILCMTIMLLAFLLCGHWVYFLYPKFSYVTALTLPFFTVGLVGGLSSSRG